MADDSNKDNSEHGDEENDNELEEGGKKTSI